MNRIKRFLKLKKTDISNFWVRNVLAIIGVYLIVAGLVDESRAYSLYHGLSDPFVSYYYVPLELS